MSTLDDEAPRLVVKSQAPLSTATKTVVVDLSTTSVSRVCVKNLYKPSSKKTSADNCPRYSKWRPLLNLWNWIPMNRP